MNSFLAVGFLFTLIMLVVPSYRLTKIFSIRGNSIMNRIFLSVVLSFSFLLITGFVLSSLSLFEPFFIILAYLLYFYLCNFICKKNYLENSKSSSRFPSEEKIVLVFFVLMILFSSFYSFVSSFPVGHDRGKHFGEVVYTLNNGQLTQYAPGTVYNPFYFEGPNLIMSSLVGIPLYFVNIFEQVDFAVFETIKYTSFFFKIYFVFIISLSVLAIYYLTNQVEVNKKVAVLSSFVFLLLSFGYVSVGSIGTILGFLFFIPLIVVTESLLNKPRIQEKMLFFLLIFSILMIHIITIAIMFSYLAIVLIYRSFAGPKENIKGIVKIFMLALFVGLFFILIFYKSFFFGFIEEGYRKAVFSKGTYTDENQTYFERNISDLLLFGPILFSLIPLVLLGGFRDLRGGRKVGFILFFSSMIFVLIPIVGLPKSALYLIYPSSMLAGLGILSLVENFGRKKVAIIILIIVITAFFFGSPWLMRDATQRTYDKEEDYLNVFKMNQYLEKEKVSGRIIVFPESGARAYFFHSLSENNELLFAEPRYSDLPSMIALSKLYSSYPTSQIVYDYSSVSLIEREMILRDFDVDYIIESEYVRLPESLLPQLEKEFVIGEYTMWRVK